VNGRDDRSSQEARRAKQQEKIMNRLNNGPRNKIPALRTLLCQALFRRGLFFVALACLSLSPEARAVCQEGCLSEGNTVLGEDALISLTIGVANTATGDLALKYTTTGNDNTATGYAALLNNTSGDQNTATGRQALGSNTTGSNNTASGDGALFNNTSGDDNTASGVDALLSNTTGANNTASGTSALQSNTIGSNNTALGDFAGANLTIGSNNIDIGNAGVAGEANAIRIGAAGTQTATFIAGISGATVARGVAVVIDADGHLGVKHSSARFKEAIKPMDNASEAILSLQPVTFRYKHDLDPDGIPQFGLVAEQVEKINPDLVARDQEGKPYTVRYDAVNAMLLNEFLKEHRKVQELEATVAQQRKGMDVVTAQLNEQAAQIQKVSAQVEMSKPAPRTVLNP
jgi:hypothetical protein